MTETPFFVKLKNRGLIDIQGPERRSFLQNLITNDMNALSLEKPLYACLLTPQGKFLYDFFVIDDGHSILLDCEGGVRGKALYTRLNMYKLRADVQISVQEDHATYAICNATDYGLPDPRHAGMGNRSFAPPPHIPEQPFEAWDKRRISLTIPDGSRDLMPEKSTMDEAKMDQLHAISYDKGCYIGQELTARMHYRGLGKKHLKTIALSDFDLKAFPGNFEPLIQNGKTIGEMRSSCETNGIALIKQAATVK